MRLRTRDEIIDAVPILQYEQLKLVTPQVLKLQEEIEELWRAAGTGSKEQVREEMGDIIHCALVLLRILGSDKAWTLLESVIEKNRQRGYYI